MSALLLAAALAAAPASDAAYRDALRLVYAGQTEGALLRLSRLAAGPPPDPMGLALEGLALAWKVEQRPDSQALDKQLLRLLDQCVELADARLRADPGDDRALLARGAAHGVRSRLHLFRAQKREAANAAVKMREDLGELLRREPDNGDAEFGLGLYDYYADVLPRMTKLLRFLAGIPGGDRERGLERIRSAEKTAVFYRNEATYQLFVIDADYEKEPERALERIAFLRRRFPGSPLWALLLARHERDRLGLYPESAGVAREVLAACERGEPGYGPAVAAMARVSQGESLLLDLRLGEGRRVLLPVKDGIPEAAWVGPTARLLLGRCLELEGDRDAALAHYRAAAGGPDRGVRRQAREALAEPLPAAEVKATHFLAEGRRLREAGSPGRAGEAFRRALQAWPDCREASLRVAEAEIARGERGEELEHVLDGLARNEDPQPPWLRAWARLLLGRLRDLRGERGAAVKQYEMVFKAPSGLEELRRLAAEGLDRPFVPPATPTNGAAPDKYQN